jgi:hypothetical protein
MSPRSTRSTLLVIGILLLLGLGVAAGILLHQARTAADYSAHAALTKEICDQLAAVPPGSSYPESLSQLRLTFPDGGDATLLKRFSYHCNRTNCTLQTRLGGEEIVRSFP